MRSTACDSPGGTTDRLCASSRALGRGSAVRTGSAGTRVSSSERRRFASWARVTSAHWPTACSMGCNARPIRIDPAIIAPPLSWPFNTSQAPRPSIADCKNIRKVFDTAPKVPPRSPTAMLSAKAVDRAFCQRSKAAPVMPSACTASASSFIISDTRSAVIFRLLVRVVGPAVIFWFITVRITRNTPPATASHPSKG